MLERIAAAPDGPVPVQHLPTKQRRVLEFIDQYMWLVEGPCPVAEVARKLGISRMAAREHIVALHRKGWLDGTSSPVRLRFSLTKRPPRFGR
jgi:predicted ArsR family transcriptional regulator